METDDESITLTVQFARPGKKPKPKPKPKSPPPSPPPPRPKPVPKPAPAPPKLQTKAKVSIYFLLHWPFSLLGQERNLNQKLNQSRRPPPLPRLGPSLWSNQRLRPHLLNYRRRQRLVSVFHNVDRSVCSSGKEAKPKPKPESPLLRLVPNPWLNQLQTKAKVSS